MIVVGSAPIAPQILTFLRATLGLGCVILEGYGLTECSAPCTLTIPGRKLVLMHLKCRSNSRVPKVCSSLFHLFNLSDTVLQVLISLIVHSFQYLSF